MDCDLKKALDELEALRGTVSGSCLFESDLI